MLAQTAKHFDVYAVAEGVYAAVAKDGSGAMANVGFVDLGKSILVFDSVNTQQAADELRTVITSLTGKPVSHLINSHWHGDHVRGNQMFRDVSIVATERTRNIMHEIHPARIARQRSGLQELSDYIRDLEEQQSSTNNEVQVAQFAQQISIFKEIESSLPTLELVLPNETFESHWHLQGASRKVVCHTLGGGHTACDAFLYIPDVRVCFIGDLVAVNNHMLIVDGDIQNWIMILDALNRWEIDYVVPGHGPVGGKEWITRSTDYLSDLIETSSNLQLKGITPDSLDDVDVPSKYEKWSAREVYLKNIRYLLDQL